MNKWTPRMSPQARRRLANCIHGQEIVDLAEEIAEALAVSASEFQEFKVTILAVLENRDAISAHRATCQRCRDAMSAERMCLTGKALIGR